MKIVFMGTPEFALPALQRLIESRHEVVLVITQPDRPKGRGKKVEASAVRAVAEKHGLPVIVPEKLRKEDVAGQIRATGAEACVVAAYGRILPDEVLEATRLGCLNIHPSLLPAYRGAAPMQRCLLEGITETGVTIMRLVSEMDAGPIVSQQRVEILPDDDARSLSDLCSVLGADMLLRVLDEAERTGRIDAVEQDHTQATYAPPIAKAEGLIPWTDRAEAIIFRLRALTPWPGAYTFIDGERQLTIAQAEPWEEHGAPDAEKGPKPGTVISLEKGRGFVVQAGDMGLLVTRVKPEGKGEMEAYAFVVGRGVKEGDVLGAGKSMKSEK
jgi:methionyl-tRNA formyltransferase